jgi:hypothetical protein
VTKDNIGFQIENTKMKKNEKRSRHYFLKKNYYLAVHFDNGSFKIRIR